MRLFITLFFCLILMSCSHFHVYRPTIEQGNIVTEKMVNKLHFGMTQHQVKHVMGAPILKNTFTRDRMNYVYMFKSGTSNQMIQKRVTLIFHKGSLVKIEKDL